MSENAPNLRLPIILAIVAAVLTIVMKSTAYLLTGSAGLLADALESLVNLLAAVAAYFSLWYSARPVDTSHAYGHEKIEFFSSGLEGVLVAVAGLGTAGYAIQRLIAPEPLEQLGIGSGIALAAAAINCVVARILLRVGRKQGSLVLEASGEHIMTDVWSSVVVVSALVLVTLTGWTILDSLLALAVGLHIIVTGFSLVRRSFDGLMDHALPPEEQEKLREVIRAALPAGSAYHLLRTRQAGRRKFVDFHLLVPGAMTVQAAHAISETVEEQLRQAFSGLEVSTHIEPIEEPAAWEARRMAELGETIEPLPRPPSDASSFIKNTDGN
ncbi:MAG: cation diffusion facilitator family transporter [Bacteroidales bacterium]|nr:cation diffusion facilitator family transporter [Bacteroidales bacterium]